jgi:hypothetical protein
MGNYTVLGEDVDNIIESYLHNIVKDIVQQIPEVNTILLTGGFGRGEGTIRQINEKKIQPLKDFDFFLIFNDHIPSEKVRSILKNLRKKVSQDQDGTYAYTTFTIDLNATTLKNMNLMPDIMVYEAKVASKLVYGPDIRPKIQVRENEIPLRSGARILFQKGISLIGQMDTAYFSTDLPDERKEMFYYECSKVFVEIGTALSIIGGFYKPSYKERAMKLKQQYQLHFPELFSAYPNLADKILFFTEYKLQPDNVKICDNPVNLWIDARDTLLYIQKYYFSKFLMNDDISNEMELNPIVLSMSLQKSYYLDLISCNLATRIHIKNSGNISIIFNKLFQIFGKMIYLYNIQKKTKYQIAQKNINFICPAVNFFCATISLIQSVGKNGQIDRKKIKEAYEFLEIRYEFAKNRSDIEEWADARTVYLECLKNLPYMY